MHWWYTDITCNWLLLFNWYYFIDWYCCLLILLYIDITNVLLAKYYRHYQYYLTYIINIWYYLPILSTFQYLILSILQPFEPVDKNSVIQIIKLWGIWVFLISENSFNILIVYVIQSLHFLFLTNCMMDL